MKVASSPLLLFIAPFHIYRLRCGLCQIERKIEQKSVEVWVSWQGKRARQLLSSRLKGWDAIYGDVLTRKQAFDLANIHKQAPATWLSASEPSFRFIQSRCELALKCSSREAACEACLTWSKRAACQMLNIMSSPFLLASKAPTLGQVNSENQVQSATL